MATVTIALNGRNYDIAVGVGEEARVQELAGEIRRRMESLTRNAGTLSEEFENVGLTAGTSTLDATIDEVHQALMRLAVGVEA